MCMFRNALTLHSNSGGLYETVCVPECVRQPVAAQVEDLRVGGHVRDGGEGGVDALHRLLAALPLARARLGALHSRKAPHQHGARRRHQHEGAAVRSHNIKGSMSSFCDQLAC